MIWFSIGMAGSVNQEGTAQECSSSIKTFCCLSTESGSDWRSKTCPVSHEFQSGGCRYKMNWILVTTTEGHQVGLQLRTLSAGAFARIGCVDELSATFRVGSNSHTVH